MLRADLGADGGDIAAPIRVDRHPMNQNAARAARRTTK